MKVAQTAGALALVIAASAFVNMYYVSFPVRSWDETFHVKSSLHSVSEFKTHEGYGYATDHPTLKRLLYGAILHANGITVLHTPDVDYSMGQDWNVEHGHLPPFWVTIPLRAANAVLVTAATVAVFFAAFLILGNPWTAALVVAPLVVSQRIAVGVVSYVGCDALLEFFFALTLLALVVLAKKGKGTSLLGVFILGVVSGLAASTKLNGALAVVAVMVYLAVAARGIDRLLKPIFAGAVASLVFVLLNPVVRGGGLGWAFGVISDMLERRRYIWMAQYSDFGLSRGQLVARFFPYAAFALPLAAAFIVTRKEKWCAALLAWAVVLVVGTLASVNRTYDRYFMPVELGTFTAGGVFAWALFSRLRGSASTLRRSVARAAASIGAAVVALVVAMTVLAAWMPWNGSRPGLEFTPAGKVRLFFRQAVAYYGLAEPADDAVYATEAEGEGEAPQARRSRLPEPLFTTLTRRMIGYAFYIAGLAVIARAAGRALGSRWTAVLLLLPFLWIDFADGDFWLHSIADSFLVFASALFLLFAFAYVKESRSPRLRDLLLAAGAAGLALAVAPRGAALVCAVTALASLSSNGLSRFARAAAAVGLSLVSFIVFEWALRHLACYENISFVRGIFAGRLSHWYARFETIDPLIPLRDCIPWWPLVPLAAAAVFAARREKWVLPVALYGAFTAVAVIVGLPTSVGRIRVEVPLALALAGGLPALSVLLRLVNINVRLTDPATLDDYRAP